MTASAKHRYLDIAAAMVNEHVAGEPAQVHLAAHVKLAEVARRIGMARSTLYRWWPTQRDYWRDLVLYAVTKPNVEVADLFAIAADVAEDPDSDLDTVLEALRPRMADVQAVLAADPGHMMRVGLAGYPKVPDLGALAAYAERRERQQGAATLVAALRTAGRRPVAPLTPLDLATAISMMLDGVVAYGRSSSWFLEHRIVLDEDHDRPWSLSGLALRAILTELTEPGELPAWSESDDGGISDVGIGGPAADELEATARSWSDVEIAALETGTRVIADRFAVPDPSTDGAAAALGHVTLSRVARVAGVTRRQMYHLWPTQGEFRRDLIGHLVVNDGADYMRRFDASAADATALGDRDRFVLEMVDAINAHRRSEAPPEAGASFALQPHMNDPALNEWNRSGLERRVRVQRERVEALAAIFDMVPIPGATTEDVTALALMGAGGSERLHRADRTAMRYDLEWRGGRYSIFAILNQALMEHVLVDRKPT